MGTEKAAKAPQAGTRPLDVCHYSITHSIISRVLSQSGDPEWVHRKLKVNTRDSHQNHRKPRKRDGIERGSDGSGVRWVRIDDIRRTGPSSAPSQRVGAGDLRHRGHGRECYEGQRDASQK